MNSSRVLFHGKFKNFDDFCDRVVISKEQLIILIKANAFRFIGLDKHKLMWEAYFKTSKLKTTLNTPKLFKEKPVSFTIPEIKTSKIIEAYDQVLLFGFPLISRFEMLLHPITSYTTAQELPSYLGKVVTIYGSLVTAKGTPTKDKRLMHFGTFLDYKGKVFDTVHFPGIAEKFSIKTHGVYKIIGKVCEEMDYYSITVNEIYFQPIQPDPRHHLPENSNKNIA